MQFVKLSEKDIVEMIFFPVVNEACRVFAEGIAVKASDIDIAAVMGMGFPPYRFETLSRFSLILLGFPLVSQCNNLRKTFLRGGLMFWADFVGSKYIYSRLEEWSNLYGGFFKPCAFLAERAAKGAPLVSKFQTVHVLLHYSIGYFMSLLHPLEALLSTHCVSQSYDGIIFSSYLSMEIVNSY